MNDMTERNDRVWLITGATSGLGRALARAALDAGESVAGTARDVLRGAALSAEFGERFMMIEHDVRDTDAAPGVIDRVIERYGHVDVLVNNAGVGQVGTAEEIADADLRDMLAQHLFGPAALVRAVLPHMRAAGRGAVVQMSSQGGRRSFPAVGSYSAGKFALEGWSEALAGEVSPFGIRVLIVEPSRFRTGFNRAEVLRTAPHSAAYEGIVRVVRDDMAAADGVQEGDPDRAAALIRRVLADPDAPLRLPLGAEAVESLGRSYEESLASLRRWAALSASADFPGMPPAVRPV